MDVSVMFRQAVDAAIEFPIVTSFTSIGPAIRRRLDGWTPLGDYDLTGKVVVLTGATSGLGAAAADRFAGLGADLVIVGRDRERTEASAASLGELGAGEVTAVIADMGELADVGTAAETILTRYPVVHVLVHNAGALVDERRTTSAGHEATVASQVYGPHLLTRKLLPALRAARPGRVLTMSSGGMYTADLEIADLEMDADSYTGTQQYARAKRAQVALAEKWAARVDTGEVVFHTLHPGWADTPGVEDALPGFHRVLGPVLRSAEQGADTLVWLTCDDEALTSSGDFWLDRRRRTTHRLPSTKRSDTPERRAELWAHVEAQLGQ